MAQFFGALVERIRTWQRSHRLPHALCHLRRKACRPARNACPVRSGGVAVADGALGSAVAVPVFTRRDCRFAAMESPLECNMLRLHGLTHHLAPVARRPLLAYLRRARHTTLAVLRASAGAPLAHRHGSAQVPVFVLRPVLSTARRLITKIYARLRTSDPNPIDRPHNQRSHARCMALSQGDAAGAITDGGGETVDCDDPARTQTHRR